MSFILIQHLLTINGQSDRIDIYLYPEDNNCSGGAAYCDSSTKTGIGLGGKLRYTGWVVAQNFAAHEMGHILGLQHTFGPDEHPSVFELIDGSNCSFTGDGFCGTPATFQGDSPHPCGSSMVNLGVNFEVSSSCVWLNPKQEPSTGQYYTPDLNNYMEYTHPNCMTHFSTDQVQAMRAKMESQTVISPAITSNIWGTISYVGGSKKLISVNFLPQRNIDVNIQALNVNNFNWTLISSYSPTGNNYTPFITFSNGATISMTIPQNGSATFEVDYTNICNLGPATYVFIHSGGFYSTYPTTTNSTFNIKAIDNYEINISPDLEREEIIEFKPYINTVDILDNNGIPVLSQKYPNDTKEIIIDLSNHKKGVYFVKLNKGSDKYAYETKVIKL